MIEKTFIYNVVVGCNNGEEVETKQDLIDLTPGDTSRMKSYISDSDSRVVHRAHRVTYGSFLLHIR